MKRTRMTWPPDPIKPLSKNRDGQPVLIWMARLDQNDKTIRGRIISACCDCGMEHLYSFEMLRDPGNGDFWLVKRAYRIKDGRIRRQRVGRRKTARTRRRGK